MSFYMGGGQLGFFMTPTQLASCTQRGLGDAFSTIASVDPEPISSITLSAIGKIASLFGFGAGRTEADVITPVQNRVQFDVLAPVSSMLNSPNAGSFSCGAWQQALNALTETETNWLNWLHNTPWKDGRAAKGAESTLAPYFAGATQQLQARLTTCSTFFGTTPPPIGNDPGIPGNPLPPVGSGGSSILTAGFSTPLAVGLGILALFYFSRRSKKSAILPV